MASECIKLPLNLMRNRWHRDDPDFRSLRVSDDGCDLDGVKDDAKCASRLYQSVTLIAAFVECLAYKTLR